MGIVNIFTNEQWKHIEKHNKNCKTILQLIKSLKDNDCDLCRRFYLKLWAMKCGFLVQNNGNYYVFRKELNNAMEVTL